MKNRELVFMAVAGEGDATGIEISGTPDWVLAEVVLFKNRLQNRSSPLAGIYRPLAIAIYSTVADLFVKISVWLRVRIRPATSTHP